MKTTLVHSFDLVRLSHSKAIVGISPNKIRQFVRQRAMRLFNCDGMTFFSKSQLHEHLLKIAK